MKKHGEETVRKRVGLGSNQRDLFHYLVCGLAYYVLGKFSQRVL